MKALRASARAMSEVPLSGRPAEDVVPIMPAIISSLLMMLGSPRGVRCCWRGLVAVVIWES